VVQAAVIESEKNRNTVNPGSRLRKTFFENHLDLSFTQIHSTDAFAKASSKASLEEPPVSNSVDCQVE